MMARKRGKTWQARISYTTPDGKHKQEDKGGFTTKAAATAYEAQRLTEINQTGLNKASEVLFTDYFDDWLDMYLKQNLKPQTVQNYQTVSHTVHKYFHNFYLNDLTRKELQRFVNEYSETHKASSTKQLLSRISMPLKEAFNDGLIQKNPTSNIRIPKEYELDKKINFLEEPDLKKVLNYIEDHPLDEANFAIYTALLSGMRIGELQSLTYADIDTKNQTIHITKSRTNVRPFEYLTPKTKTSIRTIKMPDRFFTQLNRYKTELPHTDEHFLGDDYNQVYFSRQLKKLLETVHASNITFHGLRHTHASYLINNGIDVAYVSERLGHSNVSTTQKIYFHLLDSKRTTEEEKVTNLF